jgi:y4mF family transcriptional regulator
MNIIQLGSAVRERRKTLGLNQQALAEVAGMSVHALSNLESGRGNPTFAMLHRVADALGLELHLSVRRTDTAGGTP